MASSTWYIAFSKPERLLHTVSSVGKPEIDNLLLHALLSANMEFRNHTFKLLQRTTLTHGRAFLATTFNLALAAIETSRLLEIHAFEGSCELWSLWGDCTR